MSDSTTGGAISTDGLPDAATVNAVLGARYQALRNAGAVRHTHLFEGRYENTYIERADIPEIEVVLRAAVAHAARRLQRDDLRVGFWFNETLPGQRTLVHSHDDADELLSGVYYVTAPAASGDLLIHLDGGTERIAPVAGRFVFFPPDLPHEVETHLGEGLRLSLAMNFGPVDGGEFFHD